MFNQVADIRLLLLSHPDREMIKASCLHSLGDKFQAYSLMLDELDKKLPLSFRQTLPASIDTLELRVAMLKHEIAHTQEQLAPLYKEFYHQSKKNGKA